MFSLLPTQKWTASDYNLIVQSFYNNFSVQEINSLIIPACGTEENCEKRLARFLFICDNLFKIMIKPELGVLLCTFFIFISAPRYIYSTFFFIACQQFGLSFFLQCEFFLTFFSEKDSCCINEQLRQRLLTKLMNIYTHLSSQLM